MTPPTTAAAMTPPLTREKDEEFEEAAEVTKALVVTVTMVGVEDVDVSARVDDTVTIMIVWS